MGMTLKEFLMKYPKPKKCPMPDAAWADGLSYCWGYAQIIDDGKVWDDSKCPCEFFDGAKNTEQLLQPDAVAQVKQMLDRQSRHKSYGFTPIDCERRMI